MKQHIMEQMYRIVEIVEASHRTSRIVEREELAVVVTFLPFKIPLLQIVRRGVKQLLQKE